MDIRRQFGRAIRELREANGLTQEDLAFSARMNVTYLSDLERGLYNPSLAIIASICFALKVQPSRLLRDVKIGHRRPKMQRKQPRSF
jgi:transcriptional regulator with XRE-family HTH domain